MDHHCILIRWCTSDSTVEVMIMTVLVAIWLGKTVPIHAMIIAVVSTAGQFLAVLNVRRISRALDQRRSPSGSGGNNLSVAVATVVA